MPSITDIIINVLLKKGLIGEVRNFETEIDIPQENGKSPIKMVIKSDHLRIRLDTGKDKE
jgi:hypothetical protein